jgi:two-component system chemotaxis response regulator CheB
VTIRPIRVLIVDDSALVRELLTGIFASDPAFVVVGTAPDPIIAREKIKQLNPDVLTLDVEMPRMNGIEFLKRLMRLRPMPVVMISTKTVDGTDTTIRALELGAVDFVAKPTQNLSHSLTALSAEIRQKVRTAAEARLRAAPRAPRPAGPIPIAPDRWVIGIGASTGGVEALGTLLEALPGTSPGIVVVQHMPQLYTGRFAERLDERSVLRVVEGTDGMAIEPGMAIVAPGGRHCRVIGGEGELRLHIADGELESGHMPSVDVLFRSLTPLGRHAAGVLLTGMGRDGASGLLEMRRSGALTIAQDEATSVVYGMPRAAKELGAASLELPLSRIGAAMLQSEA